MYDALTPGEQAQTRLAMKHERNKREQFHATKDITQYEMRMLERRYGRLPIVNTRWVLTRRADGSVKARLVVVGCQE